jgi:hypothetical protein
MLPIPSAPGIGLADRAAPGGRQYGSRDLAPPEPPLFSPRHREGDSCAGPVARDRLALEDDLCPRPAGPPSRRPGSSSPPPSLKVKRPPEIPRRVVMPFRRAAALSGGRPLWTAWRQAGLAQYRRVRSPLPRSLPADRAAPHRLDYHFGSGARPEHAIDTGHRRPERVRYPGDAKSPAQAGMARQRTRPGRPDPQR